MLEQVYRAHDERCYGRVNWALYAMPRTTFLPISKTFPATTAFIQDLGLINVKIRCF